MIAIRFATEVGNGQVSLKTLGKTHEYEIFLTVSISF